MKKSAQCIAVDTHSLNYCLYYKHLSSTKRISARVISIILQVYNIDIVGIDCRLVTVSLFRRVAHHGESKMAAQAGKSSSDRDGKNLCGRLFWETDALIK